MTVLITDHTFRKLPKVKGGMCAWHGKCNRPREEHAEARKDGPCKTTS